jgi:hypothetical protein
VLHTLVNHIVFEIGTASVEDITEARIQGTYCTGEGSGAAAG